MSPNAGGGGDCRVSTNEHSWAHHVTWSPNKLRKSNSIFNLWLRQFYVLSLFFPSVDLYHVFKVVEICPPIRNHHQLMATSCPLTKSFFSVCGRLRLYLYYPSGDRDLTAKRNFSSYLLVFPGFVFLFPRWYLLHIYIYILFRPCLSVLKLNTEVNKKSTLIKRGTRIQTSSRIQ